MTNEDGVELIAEHVFRPARPRLKEVRDILGASATPNVRAATKLLEEAGFALTNPKRSFVRTPKTPSRTPPAGKPQVATLAELTTVASDLDAIAAAEDAAREFVVAASQFYKQAPIADVVWWFIDPTTNAGWPNGTYPYSGDVALNFAYPEDRPELPEVDRAKALLAGRLSEWAAYHVNYVLGYHALWQRAVTDGLKLPKEGSAGLEGQPFAKVKNPFACLTRILALGYGFREASRPKKAIYLFAPLVKD